jgi:hypothetical protein
MAINRKYIVFATLTDCTLAIVLSAFVMSCGGAFGTSNPTSPGSTSNVPAQNSLWVLGTPGTPFQAVINDSTASWTFRGVVPESVVIINGTGPVRMVVTKLTNGANLLSIEILKQITLVAESSTNEPFGTAVVQSGGGVTVIAPRANPDIRFFVKAPSGGLFTGLIEDLTLGFTVEARSPALFLFENPNARVDGQFSSLDNAGTFTVDVLSEGAVQVQATGGPNLVVKFP